MELISREQAIDALKGCYCGGEDSCGEPWIYENHAVKAIKQLPPIQPEPREDAVSREVLKDGFTEMCNLICPYTKKQQHVMCGSCLMGTAFDVLEATPPVTPKQRTGKWIDVDVMGMPAQACDQCNTFYPLVYTGGGHHYCPNCGAKMEVTE